MKNIFNILLFFSICIYITSDIITLPFKRVLSQNINESNFYSNYANNDIYTQIKISNPPIQINTQIKMSQYSFCIRNDSQIYDYSTSSSYKINGKEIDQKTKEYESFIPSNETFTFGNDNKKLENIKFILTGNSKFNFDGVLGLKIHENDNRTLGHGLISQLKANKLLNNETFFFNFNKNSDGGELVIGEYPHLIEKYKKDYPQYQFKDTSISILNREINFDLMFRSVFWNGKEYEKEVRAHIEIESGYIKGSKYFEDVSFDFFSPHFRKGKCHREEVNVLYLAYICDDYSDLDLSKFPEIKFYVSNANYNLTLTYEELFVKKDGKVYFLVVFDKFGYNVFWTFGNTFLKRNKLVFDMDKRVIGLYDENVEKDKKFNYLLVFIIVLIIATLTIIGLTVFIIYKFFWRKRNRKPYELNEDFDYDAAINV